jgi:hypothetical protein
VRVRALDDLAVKLKYQAQNAVRGRVLGTKIQRVILDLSHLSNLSRTSAALNFGAG